MIYMRDSAVRIGPLAVKFYDLCAFWMVVLTLVLSAAKHAACVRVHLFYNASISDVAFPS